MMVNPPPLPFLGGHPQFSVLPFLSQFVSRTCLTTLGTLNLLLYFFAYKFLILFFCFSFFFPLFPS